MNLVALKKHIEENIFPHLSSGLYYHGPHHTLDVYESAMRIADFYQIEEQDRKKIGAAAYLHDVGYLIQYSENEPYGCQKAREILPDFGFTKQQTEDVCTLIMATRIPQAPVCFLCEILCDADLDYLGRDDFYEVSENLFREFLHQGIVSSHEDWDQLQIKFLSQHRFFTDFSLKFREPKKQLHLQKLIQKTERPHGK